jgi:pilus assembly protein Flp/PilA
MKLWHPFLLERIRLDSEEGQTMAEYGMLTAFIALVAVVGVTFLGGSISDFFASVPAQF